MNNYSAHQVIFMGIAGVLFIAMLPLPVDFYVAINLFAALAGGLLIYVSSKAKKYGWVLPGIAAIILYLPAFNQPFVKSTWVVIDIVFIVIFLAAAFNLNGRYLENAGS